MKIALLGDMAFFGQMSVKGNPNVRAYFSEAADFLKGFDYVVGNLETPFSIEKRTFGAKSAYICSDVENVELLKTLHVNAVTLANNHIFDFGREGYETTKRVLNDASIMWFGAEGRSLKVEHEENRLAFEGFCCWSTNPLQCVRYGEYGVNEFDVEMARERLAAHRSEGYLPIAAIHAGTEHVNFPSLDTIKVANLLSADGTLIYYGHHPHVLQSVEKNNASLLAYSLGNFCFDDVYSSASREPLIRLSENNRTSCILVVEIEDNQIKRYEILPVYIGKDRLKINAGTAREDLVRYSGIMAEKEESEYVSMRNQIIAEYISGRKQNRNLMWFLKRMRPRYYYILKNAKKNKENYNRCVSKYIK